MAVARRVDRRPGASLGCTPQRSSVYDWLVADRTPTLLITDYSLLGLTTSVPPKSKTVYRCTECGAEYPKWQGRCETCGEWNTLVEEVAAPTPAAAKGGGAARRMGGSASLSSGGSVAVTPRLREVKGTEAQRWRTGIDEFDFVLGGGIVPGSMVLVGGEPGIGKSTLLLQVAARMQGTGRSALYVSGEESPLQVKLRADRLDDPAGDVSLLSETLLETVIATGAAQQPDVMIVDSIQTVFTQD